MEKQKDLKMVMVRSIVFPVLFYLYFWLEIKPTLMFHAAGSMTNFPVFSTGLTFFREFLYIPGGLGEYAASFLSQFFYYSWTGAGVVTLLAIILSISTDIIIKSIGAPNLRFLRFVPYIILMMLYSRHCHYLIETFSATIALLMVCVYIKTKEQLAIKGLLLSGVVYYIAGGGFLLFILLCALYEIFSKQYFLKGILCLVIGGVMPYAIGVGVFKVSPADAYFNLTPFSWKATAIPDMSEFILAVYAIYLFMPLTVLLYGLWRLTVKQKTEQRDMKSPGLWYVYLTARPVKLFAEILSLAIIATGMFFLLANSHQRRVAQLEYYLDRGLWSKVIEIASKDPSDPIAVYAAGLAMSNSGRLGYDLLDICLSPKSADALYLDMPGYKNMFWQRSTFGLRVGLLNSADHDIYRALDLYGRLPDVIERQAIIQMAKGNNDSAKVLLNALKKKFFYRKRAEYYLEQIELDPSLSSLKEIQSYRSKIAGDNRLQTDLLGDPSSELIIQIKGAKNVPAFEYLMSSALLKKRPDMIVKNIPYMVSLGYKRIPRLYEEAIIVYEMVTGKKVDWHDYNISNETLNNYRKFDEITVRFSMDKELMAQEFKRALGDSYLFYYFRKFEE